MDVNMKSCHHGCGGAEERVGEMGRGEAWRQVQGGLSCGSRGHLRTSSIDLQLHHVRGGTVCEFSRPLPTPVRHRWPSGAVNGRFRFGISGGGDGGWFQS